MDRVERSKEKLKQLIGDATYDSIKECTSGSKAYTGISLLILFW